MTRSTLAAIGLLCIVTPILKAVLDGLFIDPENIDQSDLMRWYSGLPLRTHAMLECISATGWFLLSFSIVLPRPL